MYAGQLPALFEHLLAFRTLVLGVAGGAAALALSNVHIRQKDTFYITVGTLHLNTSVTLTTFDYKYLRPAGTKFIGKGR
jgi:hypothetical protein